MHLCFQRSKLKRSSTLRQRWPDGGLERPGLRPHRGPVGRQGAEDRRPRRRPHRAHCGGQGEEEDRLRLRHTGQGHESGARGGGGMGGTGSAVLLFAEQDAVVWLAKVIWCSDYLWNARMRIDRWIRPQ